jgi:alpha-glucoside transport system substrate-binding protein
MRIRRYLTRLAPAVALVLTVAGLPGCGSSAGAGTVTLLSFWTESEQHWFINQVLAEFTRETGIQVHYQLGTRAIDQELQSDLQTGDQPDIAVLSSPGDLETFAQQGALQPLDGPLADQTGRYDQQWLSLESAVQPAGGDRHKYTVPITTSLKSAIWYDPSALRRLLGPSWTGVMPTTWDQLFALTGQISAHGGTPWCMGMESTPVSGWPGTDWIEDILLHQSGPEVYQQWADGQLSWQNSAPIADAFTAFGSIVGGGRNLNGGVDGALLTYFGDAGTPLFAPNPGCYLDHAASLDNLPTTARPGVDYDFFPFPALSGQYANTVEVSGDFAAMFRSTPQAEKLIHFLASDTAQRIWAGRPDGGVSSADRDVKAADYPNSVSRRAAALIGAASNLCFDASDLMPPTVSATFYQTLLAYLSDPGRYHDPAALSGLLAPLDTSRAAAGHALTYQCGQ